jgi:hypothetical protein
MHAERVMPKIHAVLALLACVIVPGASWLDGSGSLAWTMYSKSETYRMHVVARQADGSIRRMSPTELAVRSQGSLGTYLAGAETWRHAPVGSALARDLGGLAELACSAAPRAVSVELTLERRKTVDAPIQTNRAWTHCR